MRTPLAAAGCYLAECYRPQVGHSALEDTVLQLDVAATSECAGVRLLLAVCAPADEVLYSLFLAPSVESVLRVCERAGLPADRVSSGVEARLNASATESTLLGAATLEGHPG